MWIMNPRMSFIQTGLQFRSSCDSVLTEKPITGHKTVFIISSQTGVNEQANGAHIVITMTKSGLGVFGNILKTVRSAPEVWAAGRQPFQGFPHFKVSADFK